MVTLITATLVAFSPPAHETLSADPGDLDWTSILSVANGHTNLSAMAVQPNGRIIAVGGTSTLGGDEGTNDFALVRVMANSLSQDPSFGVGGVVRTDFDNGVDSAHDVAIQSDGDIVVSGISILRDDQGNQIRRQLLVRYDGDGSFDHTFGENGRVIIEHPVTASELLLQPDGAIVVGGFVRAATLDFGLARYHPDGSADASFGVDGLVVTDFGGRDESLSGLALQDDGRIVAFGGRSTAFELARYLPDGTLDPSFGDGGKVATGISSNTGVPQAIGIQPDGRIVVAGGAAQHGRPLDFYAQRYTPDGVLDPTFDGDGRLMLGVGSDSEQANAIAIDAVGRILLAGHVDNGTDDFGVVRLNAADGSVDTSFGTNGWATADFGRTDWGQDVVLQPSGRIVVGGHVTVRVVADIALARFDGGIPHASVFFPHATDAPPATSDLVMMPAWPTPQTLSVPASSVTWLSDPAVTGSFPPDNFNVPRPATFRFVTPCTQASSRGKTVRLSSTDLEGGDEQLLGTGQSSGSCGRTEVIDIPVTGTVTLTNRRLKLTVSSPGGVHLQLGSRTFLSALFFEEGQ